MNVSLGKLGYCIFHEQMEIVFDIHAVPFHFIGITHDICFGEFTNCPPPEMTEEHWQSIFESEESDNGSEETFA